MHLNKPDGRCCALAAVTQRGQYGDGLRGQFTVAVLCQFTEALLHIHRVQLLLHHTYSRQGWKGEQRNQCEMDYNWECRRPLTLTSLHLCEHNLYPLISASSWHHVLLETRTITGSTWSHPSKQGLWLYSDFKHSSAQLVQRLWLETCVTHSVLLDGKRIRLYDWCLF